MFKSDKQIVKSVLFSREMKCNGINGFRRLAMYHKETLRANLHPVIVALLAEVSDFDPSNEKIALEI